MPRLPMHQFDSPHDCAVAPSPIVRTYRPDPPSKRRIPNMTSTKTGPPLKPLVVPRPRGGSAPRPEARSAGTAERAGRNESLVDMVRFLQSQNMPSQPPPLSLPPSQPQPPSPSDTTTALPVPISPKEPKSESKPDPKQDPKPFHRRLLQFAQRPKKESPPRSKQEEQQRQIEALTRGGYLIPAVPPKESKGQKEAKRSKESLSLSLSRSLSKSKKDVESIGQPWLQAKVDCNSRPTETRHCLGSLDLADFGSMVDVAVSLTSDLDDSVPPPYQPTDHTSQSSAFLTSSSTADPNPQNITRPTSSLASTSHSYRNTSIDEQIQRPASSAESSTRADPVSRITVDAPVGVDGTESKSKPSLDIQKRNQSDQSSVRNVTPLSPTLKLFPDVTPRKSSRGPWRNSSIPRYQMIENTTASPASPVPSPRIGPSDNEPKVPDDPRQSSDGFIDAPVSEAEPKCPGTLAPCATSSAAQLSIEEAPKDSASRDETTIRPLSLSLGTLQAFPLPAPTRPLPSLPKAKCLPTTPDTNARSIRVSDSETLSSNLHSHSTTQLVEGQEIKSAIDSPCALDSRPVTTLGSLDTGGSMADDEESLFTTSLSEHYQPTPEHCTPRGRVSSVRIPRMQKLPESPPSQCDAKVLEGQPLADSPVLGHSTLAKSNGKRAALKGLHINSQVSQKNLPFGLPSPPPTASLPSAPPPQQPPPPPPGRKIGQRNYPAPSVAILPSMRSMEAHPAPVPYRGSALSRSNSSGSSLRHESFPETYQQSRPESRAESPLPSSDDEVFGPEIDTKYSRREADNYQRIQPTRRGHETMDPRQMSSRNRLRYNPARPMTPQSRSIHSLEKTSSPQSQYSQSNHISRESQGSQHIRAAPQMDHYLEDRVANLERQNQILQAALMAALNAGVKNPLQGLSLDPNMPSNSPHAPFAHQYPGRHTSRPDSWVSSSRSSEHSGFETSSPYRGGRASVKQLDNMIEDIESGWMSDKSSLSGTRIARKR
ncbi:unnamed protein product [Penicillium egyptiacum]|uniref:Uncharacterized protein n=1 Tax=Penicillium egyptiacum TaxID=1303716 RepID=A0A9W4P3X5_9EURO|nr:unnamed protein product [Penicillium egyptiacum]